jgi:hypothetical protein
MDNTNESKLFTLIPNIGIGPFLFGKPIITDWGGNALYLQKKTDVDFWARYPNLPCCHEFHLIRGNKELIIYVNDSECIVDFNTELLYYHGVSLINGHIDDNKQALAITEWDGVEMMKVGNSLQKIYYYDGFGLMFWTNEDIVLNASVYCAIK